MNLGAVRVNAIKDEIAKHVPDDWRSWALSKETRDQALVHEHFFTDASKSTTVTELQVKLTTLLSAISASGVMKDRAMKGIAEEILLVPMTEANLKEDDARAFVLAMGGLNLIRRAEHWTEKKLKERRSKYQSVLDKKFKTADKKKSWPAC